MSIKITGHSLTKAIEKAKTACENTEVKVTDHFVEINKLIGIGKCGQREKPWPANRKGRNLSRVGEV